MQPTNNLVWFLGGLPGGLIEGLTGDCLVVCLDVCLDVCLEVCSEVCLEDCLEVFFRKAWRFPLEVPSGGLQWKVLFTRMLGSMSYFGGLP